MRSFLLVLLSTMSISALAQPTVDDQFNSWYMYFGNHRVSDRWSIHTEYQWRRSGFGEKWQQSLLRVGVDHHFKNGAQVSAGYGWIESFPYGKQPIAIAFKEHRIWQQFILSQQLWRIGFQHRFRLEHRFLENKVANSEGLFVRDGFNYRNRIRYRLMLTVPLSRRTMDNNTLFVSVYDEGFIGFGKGTAKNIFDQNRLYAALGWRFTHKLNLQLGYLNHYVIKADGIHHERNHTLQMGVQYNLDLRKKEVAVP